jgi:hypothetical protein
VCDFSLREKSHEVYWLRQTSTGNPVSSSGAIFARNADRAKVNNRLYR